MCKFTIVYGWITKLKIETWKTNVELLKESAIKKKKLEKKELERTDTVVSS